MKSKKSIWHHSGVDNINRVVRSKHSSIWLEAYNKRILFPWYIKNVMACSRQHINVPYWQCPKNNTIDQKFMPNCLSPHLKHVYIYISNMKCISHQAVYLSPWSQTSCNESRQTIKTAVIKVGMFKKSLLRGQIK